MTEEAIKKLAGEIFGYVASRCSKEHVDGEGSQFIYLTEIEAIVRRSVQDSHIQRPTP